MQLLYINNLALKEQKGFSLVELAVVVSIIGVIVAGVIGGEKLYQASKLRRLSTEIIQYSAAINTFKQEYGYYPGDFPQAVDFWTTSPQTGVTVTNGNGDGIVTMDLFQNNEDLYSWPHLSVSQLVKKSGYSGQVTSVGATHYTAGSNLPVSEAFNNMVFSFFSTIVTEDDYIYQEIGGLKLRISNLDGLGRPWNSSNSLNAKQAKSVDTKIDDGFADSGNLITHTDVGGGCATAPYNASSASYDTLNPSKDCIMEYYINRF